MKLVILGIQGSGKSTQAKLISKKYHLNHLVAGDILKSKVKGKYLINANKGILLPPNYVNRIMKKYIPKDNYLIDGYPRDIIQARFLEKFNPPDKIIFLTLSEKEVIRRLRKRALIEKRKDDTPRAIKERIKEFKLRTLPLIKFYKKRLIKLSGSGSVKKVFSDINSALN